MTSHLDDLIFQQKQLLSLNTVLKAYNCKADNLLCNKVYTDLLATYNLNESNIVKDWCSENFSKSNYHPEKLIFKSPSGNHVRSKSEFFIDQALFLNQIPFRYECKLTLNDYEIYPDFTIMHPLTHKIYYWEHFGMMDNPSYSQNAFSKMNLYNSNGIIPGIDLIMSFESKNNPFTYEKAEAIINQHFKS